MVVTALSGLESFNEVINGDTVIIEFWASWAGPCLAMSPIFERLSEETSGPEPGFYKVDVDQEEAIADAVGIKSLPTYIAFNSGEKVDELDNPNAKQLEGMIHLIC